MGTLVIPPIDTFAVSSPAKSDDPAKARDAARQFEALLIGQILHSARESGSGWLGDSEDEAGSCATDYAEQQMAAAMAQAGGLGLVHLIEQGLGRKAVTPPQKADGIWSAPASAK